MQVHLTLRLADGQERDISIAGPDGLRLEELADRLPAEASHTLGWWAGTRRLRPDAVVGGPGLRSGDIVGVGRPGRRDVDDGSVLRLNVVGGPGAGASTALTGGLLILGRGAQADIRLPDSDVSRRHAAITVTSGGVTVHDLQSTNGTAIDGIEIDPDGSSLRPGQMLRVGDSLLAMGSVPDPPAAIRARSDGRLALNRPPRPVQPASHRVVTFPQRPAARAPMRVQWAAALVPAIAGCGLALLLGSIMFLAFAALGPIALFASHASDRWSARSGRRVDARTFRRQERAASEELASLLSDEAASRRRSFPDPAEGRTIAALRTSRLWERRRGDEDVLRLRLGLGAAASDVRVSRGGTAPMDVPMDAPTLPLAPIAADLRSGALGIVGDSLAGLGLVRWLVVQICLLHSPADIQLIALLAPGREQRWRWLRWAPHISVLAESDEQRVAAVASAVEALERRTADHRNTTAPWTGPWTVVLVDGPGALAGIGGLARLLREGPRVGITAICLDDEQRLLPASCVQVVRAKGSRPNWASLGSSGSSAPALLLDRLALADSEALCRSLAPLVDPGDEEKSIPSHVRLLDELQLPNPCADDVLARWHRAGGALRTVLGVGAAGRVEIDLDRDGPHALIAGTTGSGKSELLQSLVAGLAATCPPEELVFVLIDYKGGSAFGECAALPHVVGVVTDLDSHLTERALRSLSAELRRREAALAASGARDLAQYRKLARPADQAPLPRLVLVIDEFAALADELPAFLDGLIGIAARGRSLGVHLILATQRPGGAVSPEIRANTNLRIALRVTDRAESTDVVGVDGAAGISRHHPGRALMRAGAADEAPIMLQTARIAGSAPSGAQLVRVSWLDPWGRSTMEPDSAGRTDLSVLVAAVATAARCSSAPVAAPPWLAPLPLVLAVHDPRLRFADRPASRVLNFGLRDIPDAQAQAPYGLDLKVGGSLLIAGTARSGRTGALRTIAGRSLELPVQLYVIDCAGGELLALRDAPCCGAALTQDDPLSLYALVSRLLELARMGRRQSVRALDQPVLVLIDGVEAAVAALEEADPAHGADALLALLREGPSSGMTIVLSGDRPALASRIAAAVQSKLMLRLNDPADYALGGVPPRLVPQNLATGRALLAPDGQEVQLAVLGDSADEQAQRAALAELIASAAPDRPGPSGAARPAIRIRALPSLVALADLADLVDGSSDGAGPERASGAGPERASGAVLLGVGGDAGAPMWAPLLAHAARVLIAGPSRSGRSSALDLIASQASRDGMQVVRIDGRRPRDAPSTLTDLAAAGGAILIDTCEVITDTPLGDVLRQLADDPDIPAAIVAAGRTDDLAVSYRGLASVLVRSRTGLLLCPRPGDGAVFGLSLPRSRARHGPGRGLLIGSAGVEAIQLALP